jgi:hypothetical protein
MGHGSVLSTWFLGSKKATMYRAKTPSHHFFAPTLDELDAGRDANYDDDNSIQLLMKKLPRLLRQ